MESLSPGYFCLQNLSISTLFLKLLVTPKQNIQLHFFNTWNHTLDSHYSVLRFIHVLRCHFGLGFAEIIFFWNLTNQRHWLLIFSTVGTPGRDVNFNDKAASLSDWSTRAARTGRMVAAGGSGGNKKLAESLVSAASQVGTSRSLTLLYLNCFNLLTNLQWNLSYSTLIGPSGGQNIKKSDNQRSKHPHFISSTAFIM